jgi:hypothetical protein
MDINDVLKNGDMLKYVSIATEILKRSGNTNLQDQIDFIDYITNNAPKLPILEAIKNSLVELQNIKNK